MTRSLSLWTVELGSGPAVLWLHGYSMNSNLWASLWSYLPGYAHIGVDLPGHGRSRPLTEEDSLGGLATEIACVAKERGARIIAGLSFGSMIALEAAAILGPELDFLLLGAPTLAGDIPDSIVRLKTSRLRAAYARGETADQLADLWMTSPPDIFKACQRNGALWSSIRAEILRHSWSELAMDSMQSIYESRQTDSRLSAITADTLVLVGTEDMRIHKRVAYKLAEHLPKCRKQWVVDAGHLPLLEMPVKCAQYVLQHLGTETRAKGIAQ